MKSSRNRSGLELIVAAGMLRGNQVRTHSGQVCLRPIDTREPGWVPRGDLWVGLGVHSLTGGPPTQIYENNINDLINNLKMIIYLTY